MWQSVMYSSALRQQKLRADWHERCLLSMFTLLTLSLSLRLLWNTKKGPQSPRGQLPHHAWQLGVYLRIRSEPTKVINILFHSSQVSPRNSITSTNDPSVARGFGVFFPPVRWHHYSYKAVWEFWEALTLALAEDGWRSCCQGIENRFTYPQSVTRNDGYRELMLQLYRRFALLALWLNLFQRFQHRRILHSIARE